MEAVKSNDPLYLVKRNVKGRLLDVGCGPGAFFRNESSIAIDILPIRRENFVQCDAHKLPFKNGVFDSIVTIDVIEHLRSPETFLQEAHRVLSGRGYS